MASQDVVKEIHSLPPEELTKIHKKLRSLKFTSHCDIEIDSGCLKISFNNIKQKAIEINLDDFQAIYKVDIQLLRCDMLKNERHPDVLSYVFHGLKNFTDLSVSFSPQNFNNGGLIWLGNRIPHFKRVNLNMANCKFEKKSMPILCAAIFSKEINLDSFAINLDSCQIVKGDLRTLANSISTMHKNLKTFALGLTHSRGPDFHEFFFSNL